MTKLESRIEQIKKVFTPDDLRETFVKRTDDEMFTEIAEIENGGKVTDVEPHLLVWRGFEILLNLNY